MKQIYNKNSTLYIYGKCHYYVLWKTKPKSFERRNTCFSTYHRNQRQKDTHPFIFYLFMHHLKNCKFNTFFTLPVLCRHTCTKTHVLQRNEKNTFHYCNSNETIMLQKRVYWLLFWFFFYSLRKMYEFSV